MPAAPAVALAPEETRPDETSAAPAGRYARCRRRPAGTRCLQLQLSRLHGGDPPGQRHLHQRLHRQQPAVASDRMKVLPTWLLPAARSSRATSPPRAGYSSVPQTVTRPRLRSRLAETYDPQMLARWGDPRGVLVVPVEKIEGIESPILQHPDARAYWQAALESRRFVADALGGPDPTNRGRSGGELERGPQPGPVAYSPRLLEAVRPLCPRAPCLSVLGSLDIPQVPLEGARYYGLKVGAAQAEVFNPFAALASLPGARGDLRATSLAVVGAPGNDPSGGFYVLAYWGRRSPVEKLLDPTCSDPSRTIAR